MDNYLYIFHFLFRLTRSEYLLNGLWKQLCVISKDIRDEPLLGYYLNQCLFERNEMSNVIKNLHDYLMIEVVEKAWKILIDEIKESKDMDTIVKSHHKYIKYIKDNGFMSDKNNNLMNKINSLLSVIIQFCTTQESNLINIYDRISQQKSYDEEMERRAQNGEGWAYESKRNINYEADIQRFTTNGMQQLEKNIVDFRDKFFELKDVLQQTKNYNNLLFRMDYNDFYSNLL